MSEKGMYICTLDKEYNECPLFDGKGFCSAPNRSCGMLRIQEEPKKYVRKERWYEKYYKNLR